MEFWKRILVMAGQFRAVLGLAFVAIVAAQMIGFLPVLAQKWFFDAVENWIRGSDMDAGVVAVSVAVLIGSAAASELAMQGSHYLSDILQTRMGYRLSARTADHLLRLSLGFHARHDTAEKVDVVRKGVDGTYQIIWIALVQLVPAACQAAVFGLWTISIAPAPGTVMLVGVALAMGLMVAEQRVLRPIRRDFRDADRATDVYVYDMLRNIGLVKAMGSEQSVLGQILRRHGSVRMLAEAFSLRLLKIGARQAVLRHVVSGAVLSLAVWQMLRGDASLGTVTLLFSVTQRLVGVTQTALQAQGALERSRPDAEKLFDLLDAKPDVFAPARPVPLGRMLGSISFEDVSFAYPDTHGTIRDVRFYVPAGKTVAIVGKTGAGKSTLARLILRWFDPHAGRILVDGKDLRDLDPGEFLRQVGIVIQGAGLFSMSVRDNVAFGTENATDEQVEAAARMADAHGFISGLKEGYDTQVGEGGMRLSGGQAQRIALARALLRDPRLLILDEATSQLDEETQGTVMAELVHRVHGTRTVLIIAHRLSTVRFADEIVVLDDGRVVEQGTYDALSRANGAFQRFVETGTV